MKGQNNYMILFHSISTTTLLLVTDEQDRLGFVSDAKDKLHDSASE